MLFWSNSIFKYVKSLLYNLKQNILVFRALLLQFILIMEQEYLQPLGSENPNPKGGFKKAIFFTFYLDECLQNQFLKIDGFGNRTNF